MTFSIAKELGISLDLVAAEEVILLLTEHGVLTGRFHLAHGGGEFVLHLEVLLSHFILELARVRVLLDNSGGLLVVTLILQFFFDSIEVFSVLPSLTLISSAPSRNGIELTVKLPCSLFEDFLSPLLETLISLVPFGFSELFSSVDGFLWHLDLFNGCLIVMKFFFILVFTFILIVFHGPSLQLVVVDLLHIVFTQFFLDVVCLTTDDLLESAQVRLG